MYFLLATCHTEAGQNQLLPNQYAFPQFYMAPQPFYGQQVGYPQHPLHGGHTNPLTLTLPQQQSVRPANGLPEGWTEKTIGNNHQKKWYAPSGHTFNTKKGARIFLDLINEGHDDSTAYRLYKENEKRAKNTRKAQKEAKKEKIL